MDLPDERLMDVFDDHGIGFSPSVQGLWRQRRVIGLSVLIAAVVTGSYLLVAPRQYISSARLLIEDSSPESRRTSIGFLNNQIEVLESTSVLAIALGSPELLASKTLSRVADENRLTYVRGRLSCVPAVVGNTVLVNVTSSDRADAALMANAVVSAYMAFQVELSRDNEKAALQVFEKSRADKQQSLVEKQGRLKQLQDQGARDLASRANSETDRQVARLTDLIVEARVQSLQARGVYDEAAGLLKDQPEKLAAINAQVLNGALPLVGEAELAAAKGALLAAQNAVKEVARKYLPSHPLAQSAGARLDSARSGYVLAAKARLISAEKHEAEFQKALNDARRQGAEMADRGTEYARLSGELKQLQQQTSALESRMQDISAAQAQEGVRVTLLSAATPAEQASSPRVLWTLVIGLTGGLLAGLGVSWMRESVTAGLRSPAEIQATLGVAVLGAVPVLQGYLDDKSMALAADDAESAVAEVFGAIRSAIYTGIPKDRARTLLVTSAVAGEGKSTFVSNLGIELARAGKKTLIIDANLRHPQQHRFFNLSDQTGLADLLTDELPAKDEIRSAVQSTTIANLQLLAAGAVERGAAELLNQPALAELLDHLSLQYDHILIDSPATLAVADARILSASVDLTVTIIEVRRSGRKAVQLAHEGLQTVGANLLGVVVNAVDDNDRSAFGGLGFVPRPRGLEAGSLSDERIELKRVTLMN